jgi:hypothetical protein
MERGITAALTFTANTSVIVFDGSLDPDIKSDTGERGIRECLSVHLQQVDDTVERTTNLVFVFDYLH